MRGTRPEGGEDATTTTVANSYLAQVRPESSEEHEGGAGSPMHLGAGFASLITGVLPLLAVAGDAAGLEKEGLVSNGSCRIRDDSAEHFGEEELDWGRRASCEARATGPGMIQLCDLAGNRTRWVGEGGAFSAAPLSRDLGQHYPSATQGCVAEDAGVVSVRQDEHAGAGEHEDMVIGIRKLRLGDDDDCDTIRGKYRGR